MTIFLPWTYVPLPMGANNSHINCYPLSFDGMNWMLTPNCIIDNRTDQTQAVLSCNAFGTYGVRCECPPLFVNNTNVNNLVSINSTGPLVEMDLHTLTVGAGTSGSSALTFSLVMLLSGMLLL